MLFPIFVEQNITYHLNSLGGKDPEFVKKLKDSFYVDDWSLVNRLLTKQSYRMNRPVKD